MANRLTPKQEKFAQGVASGMSLSDAYRAAYSCARMSDKTVNNRAHELNNNGEVAGRVNELTEIAARAAVWTREKSIAMAQELVDGSMSVFKKTLDSKSAIDRNAALTATEAAEKLDRLVGIERERNAAGFKADYGLLLGPSFLEFHRAVHEHRFTDYRLSGGRGSLKSSAISLEIPKLIMDNPDHHAVVLRKVANTLRNSVYAQMLWSLSKLDVLKDWSCTISPMEMVYRPTGQKIYFFGVDEPEKLKSFKTPNGYVAVTWAEEYDQFNGDAELRNLYQSLSRGGDRFWRFASWNPPISKTAWVNTLTDDADIYSHSSTYLDAPREFLGEQFIKDATALKSINERAYRHEYLGEAIGQAGDVFTNVATREITADEREAIQWVRCGVDFGFSSDPWVFLRVGYDRKTKTVYILDELHGLGVSDATATERIKKLLTVADETNKQPVFHRRAPENLVLCDAAEPKSIASYQAEGLNAHPAPKFKGSVTAGIKWLQERAAIVIDKRCALATTEFTSYRYLELKDGTTGGVPDKDNHTIDAVRYALSQVIGNKKEV